MNLSFPAIITILLVVAPGAVAAMDRAPVDEVLTDPAHAVHASLFRPGDPDRDQRVQDALDAGAYRWALIITAESVAQQQTDALWDASRSQQDPYAAYAAALRAWAVESRDQLAATLDRLGQAEQSAHFTTHDVDRLLFAAQYAVLAESSLSLGVRHIDSAGDGSDNHDTPTKRHVLGYPVAQAVVFTAMVEQVLDRFTAQVRGNTVSIEGLAKVIEDQGGAGGQWLLEESGLIHRLARHLSIYETDLLRPDATRTDVQVGLDKLTGQHLEGVLERGFSGARPNAVVLDAAWWLGRGVQEEAPSSASHADVLNRVRASVELAQYEADLLAAVTPPLEPGGTWSGWPWVVAGGALAGLALVALALVRRRSGARQRGGLPPVLLAVLVAASTLTVLPPAEGGPSPAEPVPDPLVVAAGDGQSWGGSVLVGSDDTVHLAWGECMVATGPACPKGHLALRYRHFDPRTEAWSDPLTLVDVEGQNVSMPRVVEDRGGLAVVWQQGFQAWARGETTEHPMEVWWCRLEADACTETQRVSEEDAGVESSVTAVGPDGLLRVAWAQLGTAGGEVVFRQQTESGWGPLVRFPDGGTDQWQPALTVDASNTAHLAWPAKHPDVPGQSYRVVYHATVGFGDTIASQSRDVSQHLVLTQGVALAAQGSDLHLVYGTEEGMYHRALIEGEWTEAHLVSPTDLTGPDGEPVMRPAMRPDLVATTHGVAAVWLEHVYPHDGLRLRMAEVNDGLWLRPSTVLYPPHRALFNPDIDIDAADQVHLTWAGDAPPGLQVGKQHYMTVSLAAQQEQDVAEPDVTVLAPADGDWLRRAPFNLTVEVGLQAPLDEEGTQWLVDGEAIKFTAWSDELTATLAGLDEGLHDVRLTIEDTAGNRVVTEWRFGVDRTPPTFTSSVRDADDAPAEGWVGSPVRVTAGAVVDGGSPIVVEIQAIDGAGDAVALSPGNAWTEVPGDGLELPADVLLEVTVRARDEAGNVALSEPVVVGWDGSSPALDVAEPPAWYAGVVDLDVGLEDEAGAPVTVEVTLAGDGVDRTALLGSGALSFDAVPDGRYSLAVLARDAAGNEASAGPWQVGVDATRPTLEVRLDGGQAGLVARDAGSGLSSLRVLGDDGGALVERSLEGDAEASVSLEAGTRATVVVTDVAGNELRKALRAGTLEDVEEDLDDVAERGPDGRSWLTPGTGPVLLLVALGVLAGCLRRQEQ